MDKEPAAHAYVRHATFWQVKHGLSACEPPSVFWHVPTQYPASSSPAAAAAFSALSPPFFLASACSPSIAPAPTAAADKNLHRRRLATELMVAVQRAQQCAVRAVLCSSALSSSGMTRSTIASNHHICAALACRIHRCQPWLRSQSSIPSPLATTLWLVSVRPCA